jgi:Flagellar assembly protein FliH
VAADFIPLADYLRPRPARENAPPDDGKVIPLPVRRVAEDAVVERVAEDPDKERVSCTSKTSASPELVDVLRDARVFRARLVDAFDEAAARLVRELAAQVLVRELRLAPCEIAELVARARERLPVLRVRVSPYDATRMHDVSSDAAASGDVSVIADEQLDDGDAILEVAGGALDARLGVRLADVLEALA